MGKKVITAGLLGALVLVCWTFLVNGIFGFQARIDMKTLPAERELHRILAGHVVEPGRYIVNPALTDEGRFPPGEPVYSVLYGGMGHEAAGSMAVAGLAVFLLAPLTAVWLLSRASRETLSSYPRKVLFFSAIGLLVALLSDLTRFGIGSYPPGDALLFAAHDVVLWTLVGLVAAWRMGPVEAEN
jgi:hypothetical protein